MKIGKAEASGIPAMSPGKAVAAMLPKGLPGSRRCQMSCVWPRSPARLDEREIATSAFAPRDNLESVKRWEARRKAAALEKRNDRS